MYAHCSSSSWPLEPTYSFSPELLNWRSREAELFIDLAHRDIVEQAHLRIDFPNLPVEEVSLMMEGHLGEMEGHTFLVGVFLPTEIVEMDNSLCAKVVAPGDGITGTTGFDHQE